MAFFVNTELFPNQAFQEPPKLWASARFWQILFAPANPSVGSGNPFIVPAVFKLPLLVVDETNIPKTIGAELRGCPTEC